MTNEFKHDLPAPDASDEDYAAWLAPLQDEYLNGGDAVQHSAAETTEASARRAVQIQQLAGLIRKAPAERVPVLQRWVPRRSWALLAAAASVCALLTAGGSWLLHNEAEHALAAHETAHTTLPATNAALDVSGQSATQVEAAQAVATAEASKAEASQVQVNLREVAGRVVATHNGDTKLVTGTTTFAVGDELSTTAESFASLEVGHSRVDLSAASTLKLLRIAPRDQLFALDAGRVDLNIPRIPGETRSIAVQTADSLVTVKGTIFSVEVVDRDETPATVVQVTRGVVAVRNSGKDYLVHAGESWSSLSQAVVNSRSRVVPTSVSKRVKRTSAALETRGTSSDASPATLHADSRLAEQNQLFAEAVDARKSGDSERARQVLNELLRRYPNTPLRAAALLERSSLKP